MFDENNNSTYLEDFLLSLEILPNKFRRDLELLKELDKEVTELNKDIQEMEKQYLENLTKISQLLSQKKSILNPPNTSQEPNQDKQQTNQIQSITTIESELNSLKETNNKLIIDLNQLNDRIQTKLSNKTAIGQNFLTIIDQFGNKLDSDLGQFENELKGAGDYEAPRGLPPDTEIAFRLTLDANADQTLILGQVINYRSELNMYEIFDIDDHQKYTLPESQVLPLGQADVFKKLSKGENIYALYPDTTIFYPAVIVQAPKRSALSSESIVTVQFLGDEDESGFTPHRTVPLKYIVRL